MSFIADEICITTQFHTQINVEKMERSWAFENDKYLQFIITELPYRSILVLHFEFASNFVVCLDPVKHLSAVACGALILDLGAS